MCSTLSLASTDFLQSQGFIKKTLSTLHWAINLRPNKKSNRNYFLRPDQEHLFYCVGSVLCEAPENIGPPNDES